MTEQKSFSGSEWLDGDPSNDDAERHVVVPEQMGGPADMPEPPGLSMSWADMTATGKARTPIIPTWMRTAEQAKTTLKALAGNVGYWAGFHAVRSPKYLFKTAIYGPRGAFRLAGKVFTWASAESGNFHLRQSAANRDDAYTWQSLNKTRAKESKARWLVLLLGTVTASCFACVGMMLLAKQVAGWTWWLVLAGVVMLLARVGRPADKPIVDRVSTAARFTKLTAEMVRNAIVDLNLTGLRDPERLQFVHPGVHRDGPGWLARVNLPQGVEAVKVITSRGGLSSALRLPVDQVWPSAGPEHAGQLDLWVGYQPASKMGQPKWSIAKPDAVTSVFAEHDFGSDERQRPVKTALIARSWLLGGQPGSGKTYAARAIALMAALDPTAEFKIAEFKGTGDFLDFAPLCSTYVVGVDDDALHQGAAILMWGLAEAERRGRRILLARQKGLAPEGKVTPELARMKGSGLHPIVIVIDEAHELFAAIPEAAVAAERLIKRARALGIIIVLATQIPDKSSLPPNITRCVTNRWCLSVAGQVENDMILGTGAYKRGLTGTVYRPVIDAGWGCMTGGAVPTAVRSQYPDQETTEAILARALALRGGTLAASTDQPQARDLLVDLAEVSGSNGQHWGPAADGLRKRWPNSYPTLTAEALSEMARDLGVQSQDIKIARRNLKGYRLDLIRELIAVRAEKPATDIEDLPARFE